MTEFRKGVGNLVTSLKGLDFLHRDDVVSSWSSTTTDDNLPTEKLVKDTIDSTNSNVSSLSSQMSSVQAFVNNATTDKVYDMSTLSNLNTTPHTSQQAINSAIDTALGDIVADEDLSVKVGSEKAFVVTSMTTKGKNMLYNINLSVNDYQTVGTFFVKVPSYTQGTNYSVEIVCRGMNSGSISVYDGSVRLYESGANGYILKLSYDSSSGRFSLVEKYLVDKLLPYFSDLSTVATTGSYDDLSGKPSIPTVPSSLSSFTNDTGFITSSDVPSASSTTPSADTVEGSVGTGVTWARSNHTHPKSDLYAEASHTHSEYVNPTIVDNLTTNDATKVLSAKQGKVLNDLIGDAIEYINQ